MAPVKKKLSYKERQEYENLQAEIQALEKRKAEIETRFAEGNADHIQMTTWTQEIQRITDDIDVKTMRWLELDELMEP